MLFMLKMSLWWYVMRMYMGGAVTMMDIHGGGNKVVKEL